MSVHNEALAEATVPDILAEIEVLEYLTTEANSLHPAPEVYTRLRDLYDQLDAIHAQRETVVADYPTRTSELTR